MTKKLSLLNTKLFVLELELQNEFLFVTELKNVLISKVMGFFFSFLFIIGNCRREFVKNIIVTSNFS
jgi:hypothetical protein